MRRSIWLAALVLGLSVYCPLVACSSDTASSENVAQGSVRLPLTAANSAGVLYRLTGATFSIANADGTGTMVSSDTDPAATVLATTVENGDYTVTLDSGWVLRDAATSTAVNATLLSASTQSLTVTADAVSTVIYQFSVNGQVVTTFDGTINIGIAISNCGNGIVDAGEQCDDGNNVSADGCTSSCTLNAASTCTDGVRNGNETAIDCGGSTCAACAVGNACSANSDCASGRCSAGVCAVSTCTDGVRNGNETAIDCGGNACSACSIGKACSVASDCASASCVGGLCATAT